MKILYNATQKKVVCVVKVNVSGSKDLIKHLSFTELEGMVAKAWLLDKKSFYYLMDIESLKTSIMRLVCCNHTGISYTTVEHLQQLIEPSFRLPEECRLTRGKRNHPAYICSHYPEETIEYIRSIFSSFLSDIKHDLRTYIQEVLNVTNHLKAKRV